MKKRLNGWKARYLSKGGRLTLIKVSLASISIHYLSVLVLPKMICTSLENIMRNFLWRKGEDGGGMHLVNWNKVCTPKMKGGAGLRRLDIMNEALLYKWLWRQVVAAKFDIRDGWDLHPVRDPYGRSLWKSIMQLAYIY